MFRTKICGVTRVADAVAVAEAGAEAIGLNFYDRSARFVSDERAAELATAVRGGPLVVGVFVNATADRVREATVRVGLEAVQFHGDEAPELVDHLPESVAIVRVVRRDPTTGLGPGIQWATATAAAGRPIGALLVDAAVPRDREGNVVYGGSGHTLDWSAVAAERSQLGKTPLVLAGGLSPANVAEAIAASGADGVDTASGVESAPGLKDPELVGAFVQRANAAFAARGS